MSRWENPKDAPGFFEWIPEPEECDDEVCLRCDQSECVCINRCQFCGVAADMCHCDDYPCPRD